MDSKGDLYQSPRQLVTDAACLVNGEAASNGMRSRKSSERFQRGLLVLTNAAGVLSCATTVSLQLFQHGYGGDASGAGFPAGALFRTSETNVPDANGLSDCVIRAVGVELEEPHYITGSGDTFTVADSVELADYRTAILRHVSQNLKVDAVVSPAENAITWSLGNALRNPSHRGANDLNAIGAHATVSIPLILREEIKIPAATGSVRPFSVTCSLGRALSIGARSTPTTANVYVPITVSLEIAGD